MAPKPDAAGNSAAMQQALSDAAAQITEPATSPGEAPEPTGAKPNGAEQPEPGTGAEPDGSNTSEGENTEVPDAYFGHDLTQYSPEVAKEVHTALEQANRVANKRLQEIAEQRKVVEAQARQPAEPQAPTAPAEVTDEDILRSFGIDPENPYAAEIAPGLVKLGREMMGLRQELETSTSQHEAQQWESQFHSKLDAIERQYGELPFERNDIVQYAIENDVYSPEALYWSIQGPIQKQAADIIRQKVGTSEQQVREIKKAVTSPRGRTSSPGTTEAPVEIKKMSDAFELARQKTGLTSFDS